MMFINIDASRAYTTRSASGRLVHGRQVTGGKGGKGGNLTPARPDRLCSPNTSPCSGGKEFPVAAARTRAISCRIPLDRADPVIGYRLKTDSGNCGKCGNWRLTQGVDCTLVRRGRK